MANAGAFNLRQIILGTFDQRIHTTGQADTTDIFSQTYMEILGIETIPGTNMPANFGHMVGYDSQYYGYLVSFGGFFCTKNTYITYILYMLDVVFLQILTFVDDTVAIVYSLRGL